MDTETKKALRNLLIYVVVKTILILVVQKLMVKAAEKELRMSADKAYIQRMYNELKDIDILAEEIRAGKKDFTEYELGLLGEAGRTENKENEK